jgi:hypothetical protein
MMLNNRNLAIAAALGLSLGLAPKAMAYHDGGVAYCDGCHTMHNSKNGAKVTKTGNQFQGNPYLLQGSDQSSTCLNCHANVAAGSYHVMTYPVPATGLPPVNFSPGGDFAYLQKSYPAVGHGSASIGERHGHNIIAADYGLVADATLTTSPGGSYTNTNLSCISCHDPHSNTRTYADGSLHHNVLGQKTQPILGSGSYVSSFTTAAATTAEAVGVYRLLGGAGYRPLSNTTDPAFVADPPIAVAPSTYNQSEAAGAQVRVAYGSGMSEWCANCHAAIHNDGTNTNAKLIHPAGSGAQLNTAMANIAGNPTTIENIYNAYKSSGDLSGTSATSYLSLVPYEEGLGVTQATLATHATNLASGSKAGPAGGTENVMCLTCHRAHASGFSSMTRWNNGAEMITAASAPGVPIWPGSDVTGNATAINYSDGKTQAEYSAAMYNRAPTEFTTYQRSLCNKCHAKD